MDAIVVAGFRRSRRGGVVLHVGSDEQQVLRHVFGQMLELLGPGDEAAEDDPLAVAVGIGTSTSIPSDPALARLFPDGYSDDPEASADFRRYTEPGLRATKRAALATALATLVEEKVPLDDEAAQAWLRALNDTRLVLGERLGVTEDWEDLVESLLAGAPDDPRLPLLALYDRLTYLQESLVQALWSGS